MEFNPHFTQVFISSGAVGQNIQNQFVGSLFLLGGLGNNCLQFKNHDILMKQTMPIEKSFFSATCVKASTIFTFGGCNLNEKQQSRSLESYSLQSDKWSTNEDMKLVEARSQASACMLKSHLAFVFGGYNKELGTLDSIEKVDFS